MLLVPLRCQGIGLGGEWGGAVLMAVEHAPAGTGVDSRELAADGRPAGLLLSTLVFTVITTSLTDEQFLAWGWRVPFL